MWTNEQKLSAALRMPWTLRREETPDDGIVLRVVEIPDAFGVGDTDEEVERDMWESLRGSLMVRLEHGDPIPLPPGVKHLPWHSGSRVSTFGVVRTRLVEPTVATVTAAGPEYVFPNGA